MILILYSWIRFESLWDVLVVDKILVEGEITTDQQNRFGAS